MTTLFWNLIQVSFTTSLVLLPALLLCAVLRRRYPARAVCLLWVILSVRLLIPVQNAFPNAPIQVRPQIMQSFETPSTQIEAHSTIHADETVPTLTQAPDIPVQTIMPNISTIQTQRTLTWDEWISVIWLIGAVGMFVWHQIAYYRFRRLVRKTATKEQDTALTAIYERERVQLHLHRYLPLYRTTAADGPMLVGIVRPLLLLPPEGIAIENAPLIFRHELTHYRYGDLLCKWLFLLVKCIHWFNPIVYGLAWQGAQDLEMACDQAVVKGLPVEARKAYGQCILNDAARRARKGELLTTKLTGGGKTMKIRLQALFSAQHKRRGIALLCTAFFAITLVGGCFAVIPQDDAQTQVVESKIRTAAETYLQALVNRDAQALYDILPQEMQKNEDIKDIEQTMRTQTQCVSAYAVYPDAEQMGAYLVKNWSQAPHSSLAAPDTRTVQWMSFVEQEGAYKLNVTGTASALCTLQSTDVQTVRNLDTFEMLYQQLGLPENKSAMLETPDSQVEDLLGLAGGKLEKQSDISFRYTFFNGQSILLQIRTDDSGWKWDRWSVEQAKILPADAQTKQQMEALAERWCDAQVNGLSIAQAQTLLGGQLKQQFDEYITGYADPEQEQPFKIDNLPMGIEPERAEYQLDTDARTVTVYTYGKAQSEQGDALPRAWFHDITQVQKLSFGWEADGLRIVERSTEQAMQYAQDTSFCTTAQDVVKMGMPQQPVEASMLYDLIYYNFPVIGGRYEDSASGKIRYTFSDGSSIDFRYDSGGVGGNFRLLGIEEPQNNKPVITDSQISGMYAAANAWAEGYLHENAMYRYPLMNHNMRQAFAQEQETTYGSHWFWRIGWGSSPDVDKWTITERTKDSLIVVYNLTAGGDIFRYAEKLFFGQENGRIVVTGCEPLCASWDDGDMTRDTFLMLYAPQTENDYSYELFEVNLSSEQVLFWKENDAERYQVMLEPETALCEIISQRKEPTYQIERIGKPFGVSSGQMVDLKIKFETGGEVYVSMMQYDEDYAAKHRSGCQDWFISGIFAQKPQH